jgi:NADPH:quinone reductase-like Zn-dependent oxidoreductase
MDEDKFVTQKPNNISFEEAAAVPAAAVTALIGLCDRGQIQSKQKVLINGAAGGVGTFSVQIAKSYGTEVTGVCSTQNLDMVHLIGADKVIDYTTEDFTKNGQTYDLVLDNVGNHSVSDLIRITRPEGTCVIVGFTSMGRMLEHAILGPLITRIKNRKWDSFNSKDPTNEHLEILKTLLEDSKVVPVIDRRYPLRETAEAIGYVETGHARGKVVITMPK